MLRWSGTAFYMIGMLLTALNIFPLNLIFGAIGGILWCLVGFAYKDKALILVEAASAAIYLAGLIVWLFK
jgi:hypothetical protein